MRVRAVVADLLETLYSAPATPQLLAAFDAPSATKLHANRLAWVLAACHAFSHPALRDDAGPRAAVERFLVQELAALSTVAPVTGLAHDEERREELVRRVLSAASRDLPGESASESKDRFRQVDSIERHRVLAAAAGREKRAREVREAMARKATEEAAAKVSRE